MKLRQREERENKSQSNYRTHFTNQTRYIKRSLHEWSLVDGEAEAYPSSAGGWSDRGGQKPNLLSRPQGGGTEVEPSPWKHSEREKNASKN